MSITKFGIIWIIYLGYCVVRGKEYIINSIFISSIFQASAVIVSSVSFVSPFTLSCLIYCIYYCVNNGSCFRRLVLPKYCIYLVIFWFLATIISFFSSVLFVGTKYIEASDNLLLKTYDGTIALFGLIILLIYVITTIFLYNDDGVCYLKFKSILLYMTLIVFVISIWQLLIYFRVIQSTEIIEEMLYSSGIVHKESISFFNYINNLQYLSLSNIRISSCFMEPSYFAGFLGFVFSFFVSQKRMTTIDKILLFLILFMTILSFSATAYIAIVIGVLSTLILGDMKATKKIIKRGIGIIIIVLTSICVFDLWELINKWIIRKLESNSFYVRSMWNTTCIDAFLSTFGVGLGYRSVRGSGVFYTIIGNFGFLGFILFITFLASIAFSSYDKTYLYESSDKTKETYSQIKILIFDVVIVMTISVPDLSYSIFWISIMSFAMLFGNVQTQKLEYRKKYTV